MNCVQCDGELSREAIDQCHRVVCRHRYDPSGNGGGNFVEVVDGNGISHRVCGPRCANAYLKRIAALLPIKS